MTRLWDKGEPLDKSVERFTVGRDPELDRGLLPFDALGSAAHAKMLCKIGILSKEELRLLLAELAVIYEEARQGQFEIRPSDEDGHTAIENRLTSKLGQVGRKIHTGRSRNDQVIAAVRLFGRQALIDVFGELLSVAELLVDLAETHKEVSLPGYTHTRQAMPSTLGFLFAAHAEGITDAVPWIKTAYHSLNRCPLGSASGYGVPLALDRLFVAQSLGFESVHVNTLAVQNDRGKSEYLVLGAMGGAMIDLGRLASDLIWFSSEDFGYIKLNHNVTTGSSIMPQKRNPDVLELIRAGANKFRCRQTEAAAVLATLTSGYHRDLQLTKEPFLEGLKLALEMFQATRTALDNLEVNASRCRSAMVKSIGATDIVYGRVAEGEAFRTAYQAVAADLDGAVADDPTEFWRKRTHLGAPGALDLAYLQKRIGEAQKWHTETKSSLDRLKELFREP